MSKYISHEGVIESIEGTHLRVRILQASACSECHAKSLCSSSESKEKMIDVESPVALQYQVGDKVEVCGSMTMGRNAVWIAFGIPLLLIVLWVLTGTFLLQIGEGEIVVGVLVALSVYYLIIRMFRDKLAKTFTFWIKQEKSR